MLSWLLLFCLTITTALSQSWIITGNLTYARQSHTATLLPNGNVLVAGGDIIGNTAELYNTTTGLWTVTGNLTYARYGHTATLLPNGNVLVAAGCYGNDCDGRLNSAEVYVTQNSTGIPTPTTPTGSTDITPTPSAVAPSSSNASAIAGGIIGGLVGLALLVLQFT